MQPLDVLYIVLSISIVIFVVIFAWVAFVFIKTLKIIRRVFEEIEDAAQNLSTIKDGAKVAIMTVLAKILGKRKHTN